MEQAAHGTVMEANVRWDPNELEARIRSLDWEVAVRRVGETFPYGSGT